MFNRFFNSQTKSVGGAAGILAISSIISGLLGMLGDRMLAGRFGAGIETSIYFAAFKIPDLVYNVLISGGIVVAFLPIFVEYFSEGEDKAWQMTNYILNVFSFLLIVFCLILFILAPWLTEFIAPGFSSENKLMVMILTRILLLQPFFLGISNIFSGVLHYFNRFLSYGLAPIFYNLGIISGILFFSPYFGISGVGLGVIFGAFLHLVIQISSAINCGFKYKFLFSFKYPAVKRTFFLMLPRIFAISANQINSIVITAIASTIAAGSIAIFNFSNNLQGLPMGVLGVSLATAIFPTFSRLWANGRKVEFLEKFSLILCQTLFIIIPISILMFLLRAQIVRLILGTGRFGWENTRLTAASLGLFSLSIFASALIPFLGRVFFSLQDTKTPTFVVLITVFANIGLSFLFIKLLTFSNFFRNFLETNLKLRGIENIAVVGLPLAYSITTIFQFILLLFFLYKKIGDFEIKKILDSLKKILISSFIMAVTVYFSLRFLVNFVSLKTFFGVLFQTALSAILGLSIYLIFSKILNIKEFKIISQRLKLLL